MDERSILIAAFIGGVAIQTIVMLRGDWNWPKIGLSVFAGLATAAYASYKGNLDQNCNIYTGLLVFCFVFALIFKEDILPAVTEKVLLSYTLTFWFAVFSYNFKWTTMQSYVLCFFLLPTAATMLLAFRKIALNTAWKIAFYSWFLCIVVAIGLLEYSFSRLSIFFSDKALPWITPVDSVVSGMAFLFLMVNATYLYYFVPIPGKGQSWESRMKDWHEITDLMVQRFDGEQPTHLVAVAILGGQGGILALDYYFRLLPAGMVVSIFVLLPGILLSLNPSPKAAHDNFEPVAPVAMPHSSHLKKAKQKLGKSL